MKTTTNFVDAKKILMGDGFHWLNGQTGRVAGQAWNAGNKLFL